MSPVNLPSFRLLYSVLQSKDKPMEDKMKVEIWSDIMCPFCYMGKRKFESALGALSLNDSVEVVWHSFQLNPTLRYDPAIDSYDYLSRLKGQTREWAVKVHNNLAQTAKSLGLEYNFDKAKITNSLDAHRVIQLAKQYNLTDELEERFFKAYFTDGELMSDHATLIRLAEEAGLPKEEVTRVLESDQYAEEVKEDALEARRLGANAVPFFVMNRKYAVLGAQDPVVFQETLVKALEDWRGEKELEKEV